MHIFFDCTFCEHGDDRISLRGDILYSNMNLLRKESENALESLPVEEVYKL